MLRELRISEFILLKDQLVPFSPGFNVISGESGAGKSVVLDALDFILGERARGDLVRPGAEHAEVQAVFDMHELPERVRESLPEIARADSDSDGTLILTRTLGANGRGRAFVNGRLVTVGTLAEVGSVLVQRSHQRDQMQLLSAGYHLEMLDLLADNADLLARYRALFSQYQTELAEFHELEERLQRAGIRRGELEGVVEELLRCKGLRAGLRADLESQVKRLSSFEQIEKTGGQVLSLLTAEEGILDQLRALNARMQELLRLDPNAADPLSGFLTDGRAQLIELESATRDYLSRLSGDDGSLSTLRDQLAEVARLERKYRTTDEGLCRLLTQAQEELRFLEEPEQLEEKRRALAQKRTDLLRRAGDLHERRIRASKPFLRSIEAELSELGMAEAKFSIAEESADLGPNGAERIELLIAPNKGSRMQPLKEVASGGELSRVFLAVKKVLGVRGGVTVAVFDEVDAGVSGKTARAVGQKLAELAQGSQVLCVTHLPQVASLADQHLHVEKLQGKGASTVAESKIGVLEGSRQVEEIARMLAGYEVTPASRESARELLASKKPGKKAA